MKVSVIIPAYNSSKNLTEAVQSCLANGEVIKEIIIVDDFSTDGTWNEALELQQDNSKVQAFKNKHKGPNNARNLGFSLSSGEYIQWLDADDTISENKLTYQVAFFEANPSIDIVFSDWQIVTRKPGEETRIEMRNESRRKDLLYELLADDWMPPHCYLLRRNIAEKLNSLNAWNSERRIGQDREYYTFAALLGAQFAYVAGATVTYNRFVAMSVSKSLNVVDRSKETFKMLSGMEVYVKKLKRAYRKAYYAQLLLHATVARLNFRVPFYNVDWSVKAPGLKVKAKMVLRSLY